METEEEFFKKLKDNPTIVIQYGLFNKITIIFDLKKRISICDFTTSNDFWLEYLKLDAINDAYTMFIIIYLVSLIGNRPNDTSSIYNSANEDEKERLNKFIEDNRTDYENLRKVRNKVFAHVDFDFDMINNISNDFIEKCIEYLREYFERQPEIIKRDEIQRNWSK